MLKEVKKSIVTNKYGIYDTYFLIVKCLKFVLKIVTFNRLVAFQPTWPKGNIYLD